MNSKVNSGSIAPSSGVSSYTYEPNDVESQSAPSAGMTYNQSTGVLRLVLPSGTYVATIPVSAAPSSDPSNDLSSGTDGRPYIDVRAHETKTSISYNFINKTLTYVDEQANAVTLDLGTAGPSLTGNVSPRADDAHGDAGSAIEVSRSDHKHPAQNPSSDAGNAITLGSDGLHMLKLAPENPAPGQRYMLTYLDGNLAWTPI